MMNAECGMANAESQPIGLAATLIELSRRNAPDRNAEFISNIGSRSSWFEPAPNEFIGEPRATQFHSAEQLAAQGIVGLYRRAHS